MTYMMQTTSMCLLISYIPVESQRLQLRLQCFIIKSALMWQSPRAAQYLQYFCWSVQGVGIAGVLKKKEKQ